MMREWPFYSWRMESRVIKIRHDLQTDKYGRISRRYQSDNRRIPYGEQSTIIGDIVRNESFVGGVLIVDVIILTLK